MINNVKNWIGGGAMLALSACVYQEGGGGYTEVPEVTSWSYQCNGNVMMWWEFKEGEKGRYVFNTGSIMVPANSSVSDRNFKRQDGVFFAITGDANQWLVKNQTTGNVTTCKRTTMPFMMPYEYDTVPPPQIMYAQGEEVLSSN